MKPTTKQCPRCGSKALIHYSSMAKKSCGDCGHRMSWHLDEGESSVLEEIKMIKGERVKK